MLQDFVNGIYAGVELTKEELDMLNDETPIYYLNDLNNGHSYMTAWAVVGVEYDGENRVYAELGNPVLYVDREGFCGNYMSKLDDPGKYEIIYVYKSLDYCSERVFQDCFGIRMYEVGLRTKAE